MLSEELEETLNVAFKEAREKRHEFMTVEHLLLALVDNPTSNTALRACGANLIQLRRELYEFLDETFDQLYKTEIRLGETFGYFTLLALTAVWPCGAATPTSSFGNVMKDTGKKKQDRIAAAHKGPSLS